MKRVTLHPMTADFAEYLRDESRLNGEAESISFPTEEQEIRDVLVQLSSKGIPVTVQGARTGIAGGAVPRGGHILNLGRLNRVLGLERDPGGMGFLIRVGAGMMLQELAELLDPGAPPPPGTQEEILDIKRQLRGEGEFFFPPDPTETGASLGGMAASNASGARSYFYGPTRQYIWALRVILPNGSCVALTRGQFRAVGREFRLPYDQNDDSPPARGLEGRLPSYRLPAVKNAAGYYLQDDMDLLDLFIGSEGTLGVISEVTLLLLPRPRHTWGVQFFLPSEEQAVEFVRAVREIGRSGEYPTSTCSSLWPPGPHHRFH